MTRSSTQPSEPANEEKPIGRSKEHNIQDDQAVTSPLAVAAQLATGALACGCGAPLVGACSVPLTLIPVVGPFVGPCAMQAGLCTMTAMVGGGLEVLVGDALGPGRGAWLPVIGAQALAHLAASLLGTAVGLLSVGGAIGLALPNLPSEPVERAAYLYNDTGVLIALAVTSAVFVAALIASLATGPAVYALTAEPKASDSFQWPRMTESPLRPRPALTAAHLRY